MRSISAISPKPSQLLCVSVTRVRSSASGTKMTSTRLLVRRHSHVEVHGDGIVGVDRFDIMSGSVLFFSASDFGGISGQGIRPEAVPVLLQCVEAFLLDGVESPGSPRIDPNEASGLQHTEVLRHGWPTYRLVRRQLSDGSRAAAERLEDCPSSRVCESSWSTARAGSTTPPTDSVRATASEQRTARSWFANPSRTRSIGTSGREPALQPPNTTRETNDLLCYFRKA